MDKMTQTYREIGQITEEVFRETFKSPGADDEDFGCELRQRLQALGLLPSHSAIEEPADDPD